MGVLFEKFVNYVIMGIVSGFGVMVLWYYFLRITRPKIKIYPALIKAPDDRYLVNVLTYGYKLLGVPYGINRLINAVLYKKLLQLPLAELLRPFFRREEAIDAKLDVYIIMRLDDTGYRRIVPLYSNEIRALFFEPLSTYPFYSRFFQEIKLEAGEIETIKGKLKEAIEDFLPSSGDNRTKVNGEERKISHLRNILQIVTTKEERNEDIIRSVLRFPPSEFPNYLWLRVLLSYGDSFSGLRFYIKEDLRFYDCLNDIRSRNYKELGIPWDKRGNQLKARKK